ncbi:MAG: cytochrome C biogenesis protein [Actinomycetia bacterium]|nr:cytochrome C biogenesis protein [Actinomycetes bacterium]
MLALLGAVVAGALTTLAPCVLPLLPVIVGGSVAATTTPAGSAPRASSGAGSGAVAVAVDTDVRLQARRRALLITASLGVSVVVFTLLLKATTALIGIPPGVWQWVSGGLLVLLGLVSLFPAQWDRVSAVLRLQARSSARLGAARQREGTLGAILTGAALGPVFTSCSPLYGYVVVTVLPARFGYGLALLLAYTAGLCATLLAVSLLGQRFVRRAGWAADPHGRFRRILGAVFVVVGVLVLTGWMKDLETWLITNSPVRPWDLDSGFIPTS